MTRDNSSHKLWSWQLLMLWLSALSCTALAAPQPTGVRNSTGAHRLSAKQLQTLQDSLRHKSGFVELRFDEMGALTLGHREQIQGGSAMARALLIAAVDSANLYELESHERSPEIPFARLVESENQKCNRTGQQMTIYRVQLDFADFGVLLGARQAKASFDIGIALLHELVHGVLQLKDPQKINEIGDCDGHVNQMRRELQLPERLYYHPIITVLPNLFGKSIVHARLEFVQRPATNAQPNAQYSLTWLASQVSPNAKNIAGLQQGILVAKRR